LLVLQLMRQRSIEVLTYVQANGCKFNELFQQCQGCHLKLDGLLKQYTDAAFVLLQSRMVDHFSSTVLKMRVAEV